MHSWDPPVLCGLGGAPQPAQNIMILAVERPFHELVRASPHPGTSLHAMLGLSCCVPACMQTIAFPTMLVQANASCIRLSHDTHKRGLPHRKVSACTSGAPRKLSYQGGQFTPEQPLHATRRGVCMHVRRSGESCLSGQASPLQGCFCMAKDPPSNPSFVPLDS